MQLFEMPKQNIKNKIIFNDYVDISAKMIQCLANVIYMG